jgi:RimJ/RimL family protein N-acetyltransferase
MTNFNLQPDLKGELLHLRKLVAEDFEALYAVASDPLIWEQHPERERYQREVFHNFFQVGLESKGALVALDAQTGEIIGSSRYTGYVAEEKRVEVGYTFLARRCWGQGYNAEMKRLMLAHAFEHVERVQFYIGEQNLRSRKAIAKIGAHCIQTLQRQPRVGGVYTAMVYEIANPRACGR